MRHHTRSGLDNIWFLNGRRTEDLGAFGDTVVVENVALLERAIAREAAQLRMPSP